MDRLSCSFESIKQTKPDYKNEEAGVIRL